MKLIGFDTETWLIAPGLQYPPIVCLTWAVNPAPSVFHCGIENEKPVVEEMMRRWLEDDDVILVAHNLAYDMGILMNEFPLLVPLAFKKYEDKLVRCTYVREKLLDIGKGTHYLGGRRYNLADISKRRLHEDISDTKKGPDVWRLRYRELDGVPLDQWPNEARDYAIDDAIRALRVYADQEERSVAQNYTLPDQINQAAADLALKMTAGWGIRTDADRIKALEEKTIQAMEKHAEILVPAGLMAASPGTPVAKWKRKTKILKGVVEGILGKATPLTGKGVVKTNKETLEECHDTKCPNPSDIEHECAAPEMRAWIEFSRLQKSVSTYIGHMWAGTERPLHTYFDVLKDTGRTSSSSPNLQNQPRAPGIRECFVARPGTVFVASDYDSQEMKCLAQACVTLLGKSTLAARYRAEPDFDPHTTFAATGLMDITEEEGLKRKAAKDKEIKEMRQHAKIANFGLPGGMGENGLIHFAKGYGVTLTWDEARHIRRKWMTQWPEMDDYFGYVRRLVGDADYGTVTQLFSGRRRGMAKYTDTCNTYFQGLAADASKAALWNVVKACYGEPDSPLWGCRPVNFVHDEIIIEAPEHRAHEAAMELKKVMEDSMQPWTPDVPVNATPSMMYHWAKDAEPVWENGRLVPWDREKVAA